MIKTFTLVWLITSHGHLVATGQHVFYVNAESACYQAKAAMPAYTPEGYRREVRCIPTLTPEW